VIGTRRQIELRHRGPHQALTFLWKFAVLPDLPHAHVGVADNIGGLVIGKSVLLNISCGLHPLANGCRRFRHSITT
jgi:hypothetical protein